MSQTTARTLHVERDLARAHKLLHDARQILGGIKTDLLLTEDWDLVADALELYDEVSRVSDTISEARSSIRDLIG